jgi:polyisoprenoid-binding protein YceI
MRKIIFSLIVLVMGAKLASAQTEWQIAPGPSEITFKVKHLLFTNVEGSFRKFDGKVVIHDGDLTSSQLEARIKADSIYTGIDDRDQSLIGKDFFDAEKFSEIVFKSEKVAKAGEGENYKIKGNLTIKGTTRPIELDAIYQGQKVLPDGKTRMNFIATGIINRLDYGISWNEFMDSKALIGDQVEIRLKIALLKEDSV